MDPFLCEMLLLFVWSVFFSSTHAFLVSIPSSTTIPTRVHSAQGHFGIATHLPGLRPIHELRKRSAPGYFCGAGAAGDITCHHSLSCVGTILTDSQAYAYCSTPQVAVQDVFTTGINDFKGSSCPTSTLCCGGTTPSAFKGLAFATAETTTYTMTLWGCGSYVATITIAPAKQVLYLPSFSASLARLAGSAGSSSDSLAPTNKPASNGGGGGGGGGLSSGAQIGLGVGLGGLAGLLLCGLMFYCWRQRRKRRLDVKDVSPISKNPEYLNEIDGRQRIELPSGPDAGELSATPDPRELYEKKSEPDLRELHEQTSTQRYELQGDNTVRGKGRQS